MRKWVLVALLASVVAFSTAWAQTHEFYNAGVAGPSGVSGLRAVDSTIVAVTGTTRGYDYFEGTWTVVYDGDTKGTITLFDLYEKPDDTTAILDSLDWSLLPSVTYNQEFVGYDSIKIYNASTDTCFWSVRGDLKDVVNVHGK